MAKAILKANIPSVNRSQKFDLEVEVDSKGKLNITLPQQTVKATNCYLPFAAVVENYPVRNAKQIFDIPNLGNGQATAKSVTGRKLKLEFSPDEMQTALMLALTADYC